MSAPAITVLLPVYNAGKYLRESVASMLRQTFGDFEILLIDDGSSDASAEIVRSIVDARIRSTFHASNKGIVPTLNEGLAMATGRYVAKMDNDDISVPDRLQVQWDYMEANPGIGVCGSAIEVFGNQAGPGWVRDFEPEAVSVALLFENPICHPSVIMRMTVLDAVGRAYPANYPYAEEYALWVRLASTTRLTNLRKPLLRYRSHPQQISRLRSETQCASIDQIMFGQLEAMGVGPVGRRDLALHQMLGGGFYPLPGHRAALKRWTAILLEANQKTARFDQAELERQLRSRTQEASKRVRTRLEAMAPSLRFRWLASTWLRHHLKKV